MPGGAKSGASAAVRVMARRRLCMMGPISASGGVLLPPPQAIPTRPGQQLSARVEGQTTDVGQTEVVGDVGPRGAAVAALVHAAAHGLVVIGMVRAADH